MPKVLGEKYLEWLSREEELLGIDATARASTDVEAARRLLYSEIGYEPSESQISAFMEAGMTRYEQLPQIGVTYAREWHPEFQGYESTFRDIATGRYVARTDVMAALAGL